jgi:hypothetical protein
MEMLQVFIKTEEEDEKEDVAAQFTHLLTEETTYLELSNPRGRFHLYRFMTNLVSTIFFPPYPAVRKTSFSLRGHVSC